MQHTLVRLLGLATAGYSVAIAVRPALLAEPCGLTTSDGAVPPEVALLTRAIGARDAAIGLTMMCARSGGGLRAALVARIVADTSDAVAFGIGLPDHEKRPQVAGFAAGWALLCALAGRRVLSRG